MQPSPAEPTAALHELGRIALADTDLEGVLDQVATLAKRAVPGAFEVSVTLIRAGGPRTVACTGDAALWIDKWQYDNQCGPCLAAAAERATLLVGDVLAERRWPGWQQHAGSVGVHSALSVGLPIHETVTGALNIYATTAHAFDEDSVILAETFAGYAAISLANAHLYDTTAALARQMERALASRAVIEQAKGIIMSQRRCSADEAFAILSKASQTANRKLRDVAAELVARASRA
ncbi:transcriptional regulator [Actinoplanes sp. OR16]|uniref:GAF and ANTAR domain-containing protein n=1 Tax=Actinoplanes sp. OR16 TaxID=946334 RepID=UPI000F6D7A83|nr:GAF and ANTAR domain-containing protein [Actinoplanes sp. OR16]BBH68089.1 transcriptional regulator [Actinoplanes sp. OR16]